MPDELLRHNISDEELDQLGDNQRGFFHEVMWATITGALGAAWGALDAIGHAYFSDPAKPLTGYEQWELTVFITFIVLALFSGFLVYREGKRAGTCLKDKIRARTKSQLEGSV